MKNHILKSFVLILGISLLSASATLGFERMVEATVLTDGIHVKPAKSQAVAESAATDKAAKTKLNRMFQYIGKFYAQHGTLPSPEHMRATFGAIDAFPNFPYEDLGRTERANHLTYGLRMRNSGSDTRWYCHGALVNAYNKKGRSLVGVMFFEITPYASDFQGNRLFSR